MKTCVWVLMCVLLITCLSGCSLLAYFISISSPYDFHADITLGELPEELTVNAAPTDAIEYAWGVRIDWDANATTGDPDGFDREVVVDSVSDGPPSVQATVVEMNFKKFSNSITGQFRPHYNRWNDTLSQWEEESDDESVTCNLRGNTIGITFDVLNEVFPADAFRTRFFTLYYPPPAGPAVGDETAIVTASASTADATDDAGGYSFLDIVTAQIGYTPDL
jgi:hypothetical protein